MKRRFLAAVMAAAMVTSLLTGCGGSSPAAEGSADTATTEGASATDSQQTEAAATPDKDTAVKALIENTEGTVTLNVWAAEEDQDMVKDWIESFKAEYPEVTFDISVGVESEQNTKDTVLTDVEAAADVYSFAGDQLTDLVNAGALQEVTIDSAAIIDACGGKDAGAVMAASKDGKLYAYPATADNGYFMFYNKEYFTEDDVKQLDTMLTKASAAGKKVSMELTSGWYTLSFFVGAGFDLAANPDGSTACNWNGTSDAGIAGTEVADAIITIAENPGFVSLKDAEFATGVADGSVIAGVNGTWNAAVAEQAWGENYAAAQLPTFTCSGKQVQMGSVAGYKLFGVNPYSKNVGWAMILAEYFTDYDHQIERFKLRGAGPANVKAAASDEVLADPAIAALAAQSKYALLDGCEGNNYWTPAETFGAILVAGNPDDTDLQELLDNLVEGVSQASVE